MAVELDLDTVEKGGKIAGGIFVAIGAIYATLFGIKLNTKRITDMEKVVFPDSPSRKLLTYADYELIQARCARDWKKELDRSREDHASEVASMAENIRVIKAMVALNEKNLHSIRNEITAVSTKLDERTGR